VTALSAALTSRVAWDRVFREFSLVLPDDVWLTTLSAKSPISPVTNLSTASGGGVPLFIDAFGLITLAELITSFTNGDFEIDR